MVNITQSYSPKNNFWEFNTQLMEVPVFKKLYKADRSNSKKASSDLMWAIALINHPKSDLYHIVGKEEKVSESILGISAKALDSYWADKKDLVEEFINASTTQAERSLADWCEYMKKRDIYLKNTRYYFDEYKTDSDGNNILSKTGQEVLLKGTAEQLDKAWLASKAMWADYDKIIKAVLEEESIEGTKKEKSSTAKGEI
jgi:hypothetical protein